MVNFDSIEVFYDGVIVGEFLYSINDEIFFYRVYTKDNKELTYKYNKSQHIDIQHLKESMIIIKMR